MLDDGIDVARRGEAGSDEVESSAARRNSAALDELAASLAITAPQREGDDVAAHGEEFRNRTARIWTHLPALLRDGRQPVVDDNERLVRDGRHPADADQEPSGGARRRDAHEFLLQ